MKNNPVSKVRKASIPWMPAEYGLEDAAAIQGLYRGDATPEQQRHALKWIVEVLCATYDMSYRPGGRSAARDGDFAEGKRHVGNQIIKLTKVNISTLKKLGET